MSKIAKSTSKKSEFKTDSLIALGSRTKESSNDSSIKQEKTSLASSSTSVSSNELSSLASSNNKLSNTKLTSNLSSSNIANLANNNNNNNNNNGVNNGSNITYLDPKTIKEELTKAIDQDEPEEKLIKLVRSIILNMKGPLQSTQTNLIKNQQLQHVPDLNFLMALSFVSLERPQLFLKQQTNLIELLCTNLLFTSKLNQDNQSNKLSALKSKTALPIRTPGGSGNQQNSGINSIQPAICNIIQLVYENEQTWPDIFVKAYLDDSLGERSWVDSFMCKEFVDNIKTAFQTKQIPFSVENSSSTSTLTPNQNISNIIQDDNSNSSVNSFTIISQTDKQSILDRYESIKTEYLDQMIIDFIKTQINNSKTNQLQPATQRIISSSIQSITNSACDNKNFLKLLQNLCGLSEIRMIAVQKLESWLANPKLTMCAQDLLMAICVNCDKGDYSEKDLISLIIKLKPKLKQQQHYYDCIRELVKLNIANFETLVQLVVVQELVQQLQFLQQQSNQSQQQQQQQQQSRNQHNLNLLQTAFSTDGQLASKILAQTLQKILLQRQGHDFFRLERVLLRDIIRNSRQDFDLLKFCRELINEHLLKQYFFNQSNYNNNHELNSIYILSVAGGLPSEFSQIRERYVNNIFDLITVCILVAITPQIKDAYTRPNKSESKELLMKYYMTMAQIHCESISWLNDMHKLYHLNPNELIASIYKIYFIIEKPEQSNCYVIDNWPSEQEKAAMFRIVSEIPILSETLHQVLMIAQDFNEKLYLLMLHIVETLLKQAALVHTKDTYTIKFSKMDQFIQYLFNLCKYRCHVITPVPVNFMVTTLYWRAWIILLIVSSLDPKGFGMIAWEQYPTLRLMMEMIMTDDFNFPPMSSITDEMTLDRFRLIESQYIQMEKQEILEFENFISLTQNINIRFTEANSNFINALMKNDPQGPPRRPPNEIVQAIRKYNTDYKIGQVLCKCRQPDFLLSLIKRQNSKQSLVWLSSLIESSANDCLEIIPVQCVCEFIWNTLIGHEEISIKKQLNLEKLVNKMKQMILTSSSELTDSILIQQIKDIFDYFLNKLCSEKSNIRIGSLKMLRRLLITNCSLNNQFLQPIPVQSIDLNELIDSLKKLSTFDIYLKPLLIKYFRKVIMVETKPDHINLYLAFLIEQLLNDYKTQIELESSFKMDLEPSTPTITSNNQAEEEIVVKDESFKNLYNEIAIDLADFFFQRNYFLTSVTVIKYTTWDSLFKIRNSIDKLIEIKRLIKFLIQYSILILNLNEHKINNSEMIKVLLKNKQPFDRSNLNQNSYILVEHLNKSDEQKYLYLHEKTFNLLMYFYSMIIQTSQSFTQLAKLSHEDHTLIEFDYEEDEILSEKFYQNDLKQLIDYFYSNELNNYRFKYLNSNFSGTLNQLVKEKLLRFNLNFNLLNSFDRENIERQISYLNLSHQTHDDNKEFLSFKLTKILIDSMDLDDQNDFFELTNFLFNKYGLTPLSICLLINKLESFMKTDKFLFDKFEASLFGIIEINNSILIVESFLSKINSNSQQELGLGCLLLENLKKIRQKLPSNHQNGIGANKVIDIEMKEHKQLKLFSFEDANNNKKYDKSNNNIDTKISILNESLNKFKSNISSLKISKNFIQHNEIELKEVNEDDLILRKEMSQKTLELVKIIAKSTNQNLENNLNKKLNEMNEMERIESIAESILNFELNSTNNKNRCAINLLLDFFCHFDPHVISKHPELEQRLLFEKRNIQIQDKNCQEINSYNAITQSFLLSLLIHQANWQTLYQVVHDIFSNKINNSNPTIILDFLSSLIHIPELWKGTESRVLEKYNEENILNLTEQQICSLIDMIIEEMCLLYEKKETKSSLDINDNLVKDYEDLDLIDLKFKMNKRIQLLKHFFKNYQYSNKKEILFEKLIDHLNKQKLNLFKNNFNNNKKAIIFNKIQTLFLYCVYLEENQIINHVINPNRLFSNIFYQIDIPTQLDLKAHNLLNCFGEIEVNYSNNLTSSGIIGVSNVVTHFKKQEKQELVQFNKKQELFMSDANLVCIKLASTHPFIFIRQIPMMEGLLQGRVIYTFEEFKRRKFDKLFHYIIDLLNILVPFVFHRAYITHIESIISHYFDVFMSYCSDNSDALGSLVIKFFEFLEKFINSDINIGHSLVIKKYSKFIIFLQKFYPDLNVLKNLSSLESVPFESIDLTKSNEIDLLKLIPLNSLKSVNLLNQKTNVSIWSNKQLEPFVSKILNRDNFDGVYSVLKELDVVSQRQAVILSHFVYYLRPLMLDSNEQLRELAMNLIMRYLRLNPKDVSSFFQMYSMCLTSSNSRVFNSAIKFFPDFNLLSSSKSQFLCKCALNGSAKHNVDISKHLADAIRLMNLEKYVH